MSDQIFNIIIGTIALFLAAFALYQNRAFRSVDKLTKENEKNQTEIANILSEHKKMKKKFKQRFIENQNLTIHGFTIYSKYLTDHSRIIFDNIHQSTSPDKEGSCGKEFLNHIEEFKYKNTYTLRKMELVSPSKTIQNQALLFFQGNDQFRDESILKFINELCQMEIIHENNMPIALTIVSGEMGGNHIHRIS